MKNLHLISQLSITLVLLVEEVIISDNNIMGDWDPPWAKFYWFPSLRETIPTIKSTFSFITIFRKLLWRCRLHGMWSYYTYVIVVVRKNPNRINNSFPRWAKTSFYTRIICKYKNKYFYSQIYQYNDNIDKLHNKTEEAPLYMADVLENEKVKGHGWCLSKITLMGHHGLSPRASQGLPGFM